MASVTFTGHTHGSGLKALLELFYGESQTIPGGFRAGPSEPLFQSFAAEGQIISSCQDHVIAELAEPDPRRQIKRQMYKLMAQVSGIHWPWGSLTGIRPTYIAAELLTRSDPGTASDLLVDSYAVSPAKAALAIHTAEKETQLLQRLPEGAYAAYIGVPFCPTRCAYCSFTTQEGIGTSALYADRYLDRLEAEVRNFTPAAGETELCTLYVGGGTPAALSERQFERLLQIMHLLPLAPDCEKTIEVGRADVLSKAKYDVLRDYAVTRICLNPQTMQERTMRRINRPGTPADYEASFAKARQAGISTINMDLIAGLPGEDAADLADSVRRVLELAPESITIHTLARKRGSDWNRELLEHEQTAKITPEPCLEAALAEAQALVQDAGYKPYYLYRQHYGRGGLENVAFAKPGSETVYNVLMMSDLFSVRGFGTPSVTKVLADGKIKRSFSPKSLLTYLEMV